MKNKLEPWAIVCAIIALAVVYYRKKEPIRMEYYGITNIARAGSTPQKVGKGEIPLTIHATVPGVEVITTNNHLVVKVPLTPDLEKKGLKVSVDNY